MPYIYRPRATSAEQWKPASAPTVSSGTVGSAPSSAGFASTGQSQVARKGSVQTGIAGGAFGSLFTDPGQGLAQQGSRSQERGLPERFDANVMGLVDTAVRTPASILERPVALLNRATGGAIAKGDNGGLLGAIGNFQVGGIKPIGDLVGSVNNALAFSGNLVPALANSGDASLLAAFGERGDDFVIPGGIKKTGGGLFGIGARDMTIGDLKADLKKRGFLEQHNDDGSITELTWDQLIAKIRNGGLTGGFQFGDKAISDNLIADTAFRMLADPTNLLLGAGVLGKAGRIGKLAVDALSASEKVATAGKFARWTLSPATKLVTGSGLRAVRGTGYLADMAKLGLRTAKFDAPRAAVEAIKQGKVAQTTLKGFGLALKTPKAVFLPGKGNLAERYARGAFRMQLGGLALESTSGWVSDRLGEDPTSGFFAGIHQASQEIMEDRPLSNSSAFLFASAFGMPLMPLTREHLRGAGQKIHEALGDPDKVIWSEWLGRDLSGKTVRSDPTGRLRGKGKQAGLVEAFGSEENFLRAIDHVDMKLAFDDLKKYNPVAEHFKSFDDALRSRRIGRIVAEHASEMRANGRIKPRQRLETFEDMARSRYHSVVDREGNNLKDIREPRDFDLTPEQMVDQWNSYSKVLEGIYSKFGEQADGIIGRAKRFTKEDLHWLRSSIVAASKNGRTAIDPLRSMLVETAAMWNDPAVAANAERSNFWRSIMSMEGGNGQYSDRPLAGLRTPRTRDVDTEELLRQVDALEKEAPAAAELYGEAVAAEKAAPNDIPRSGGPMANGRFRKIYSHETLRRFRTSRNSKLREIARQIEEDKKAFEQRWTSRGNLRVRKERVKVPSKPAKTPNAGIDDLRTLASDYNKAQGLPTLRTHEYWAGDPDFGRRTGLAYEDLPAFDNSPEVRAAYRAFGEETMRQYQSLVDAGYVMEPWTPELAAKRGEQPYNTSAEMQADVRNNKHLYYFQGGEPHPLLNEPLHLGEGQPANLNEMFRAVHDIMTHAQEGYQFGARGELNAAIKHAQMYSATARRAMLTETHGQNSWVNYGPHDPQSLAPEARPYAVQKVAFLPEEIIREFEDRFISGADLGNAARNMAKAMNLSPEEGLGIEALLRARAEAWSDATGRPAAEWFRENLAEINQGGELNPDALQQGFLESNYEAARLRDQRTSMHEANQSRLAYQQADQAAVQDRIERFNATHQLTDEQVATRNEALARILDLGDNEAAAQTPAETSPLGSRSRDTLEPLLDVYPPQAFVDAGEGTASPLEWHKLDDGGDFAIPGGLDGEFSLWDAWRLKAQHIDPNQIPADTRVRLYEKLFRSQQRELTNPVDNFNRAALSLMSPQLKLLANEQALAIIRPESLEDLQRIAEADTQQLFDEIKSAGGQVPYKANVARVQELARRMVAHPDWYVIHPGETTTEFAERMLSTIPGAGPKVANFLAMLGDPLGHTVGTIDTRMVERLTTGDLAGYLPPEILAKYTGKQSSFKAPQISVMKKGIENPDVPEHLRNIPADLLPANGKVSVLGGDYAIFNDALERAVADKYGDLPFGTGGAQWMEWDLERGLVEPHTTVWPGADALPKMTADEIGYAGAVSKAAGYYRKNSSLREPYEPDAGVFYQGEKGATSFADDGRAIVQGFESADLSTAVHELGHVFRRDLDPENLAVAETHYGVVDGNWERTHEESFARDFERYVRDGKAPTTALVPVFEKLRQWMSRIYRTLKGSPLASRVSPEMRKVFDSLFRVDEGSTYRGRVRAALDSGDLSVFGDGIPGVIEQAADTSVGDTHRATLVKRGDNGEAVAALDVTFGKDGQAAPDGLIEVGTDQAINELFAHAESEGWGVEQASLRSRNLTPLQKARQKGRWEQMRADEQAKITDGRERAKELRREIRDIDKQAERLRTIRIDDRFFDDEGNVKTDPKSLENLREQQLYMNDLGYTRQFNLEPAPQLSFRHRPEDSHLSALLAERSMLGTMLVDYGPLSKAFHAIDFLTRPVNSSKMARDSRQMLMNKLIALGAKPKEVTDFLNDVREAPANFTVSKGEYAIFRGQSALPPNKINALARKHFGENKTFMQNIAKRGGIERTHTILDEAYNSAVRRIDTKILRGQKLNRLEKVFRSGYWAFQNVPGLRGVSDGTRMLSRTVYPMFRFIFDPRWLLQNSVEADIIGFFHDGLGGTRLARTPERVVRRMGQDVNISQNALAYHAAQSGLGKYLPRFVKDEVGSRPTLSPDLANEAGVTSINHHLYPVLRRQFDIDRPETIRKIIDEMPENDPVIGLLERKFGKEKGTWGQQLDEMLYSFDRRGVRRTIDEAVRRVSKYEKWSQAEFDQMQPLISKMVERNQQAFEDLIHMHIGNVDRSRVERVMNSFWLYWPLSYQIKAAKWMGKILTDRSFGGQTNLGGAWALDRLADNFREGVQNNPGFQQQVKDNEDLWFVASMLLPIAPWDAGVSLNKLVRYAGGNVLDLWPEYAGLDNPGDYATRMLEMGPLYTVKLAQRLWDQYLSDKDKKEAA